MNKIEIITKKISVRYMTHSQEIMQYNQILNRVNGDSTSISDSLFVQKWYGCSEIYRYDGKNSMFYLLDGKKKENKKNEKSEKKE
ncbi:hypothetical protein ACXM0N_06970 [Peribacillus simplex]